MSSPPETPTDEPIPGVVQFRETILASIPGTTYQAPAMGSTAALKAIRDSLAHPEVLLGGIVRNITKGGTIVGGIEYLMTTSPIPAAERDSVANQVLSAFAAKATEKSTVGGRAVRQVDHAHGTSVGAVACADGSNLILIWGGSLMDARALATDYMAHQHR